MKVFLNKKNALFNIALFQILKVYGVLIQIQKVNKKLVPSLLLD